MRFCLLVCFQMHLSTRWTYNGQIHLVWKTCLKGSTEKTVYKSNPQKWTEKGLICSALSHFSLVKVCPQNFSLPIVYTNHSLLLLFRKPDPCPEMWNFIQNQEKRQLGGRTLLRRKGQKNLKSLWPKRSVIHNMPNSPSLYYISP